MTTEMNNELHLYFSVNQMRGQGWQGESVMKKKGVTQGESQLSLSFKAKKKKKATFQGWFSILQSVISVSIHPS